MALDVMSNSPFVSQAHTRKLGREIYKLIRRHLAFFSRHSFNLSVSPNSVHRRFLFRILLEAISNRLCKLPKMSAAISRRFDYASERGSRAHRGGGGGGVVLPIMGMGRLRPKEVPCFRLYYKRVEMSRVEE